MTYFTQFPNIQYEMDNKTYVIKDIFRQATFISEYKPLSDLYESYTILDGETPHMLADKFYGSGEYFWVILVFNNIQSLYIDWPLSAHGLEEYCKQKYGSFWQSIKHYEKDGIVVGEYKEFHANWVPPVDPENGLYYPVSFYEYESNINDEKRKIKILRSELLSEFITQFKDAING
jgi:hypothetical protein